MNNKRIENDLTDILNQRGGVIMPISAYDATLKPSEVSMRLEAWYITAKSKSPAESVELLKKHNFKVAYFTGMPITIKRGNDVVSLHRMME